MNNTYKVNINNTSEKTIDLARVEALDISQVGPHQYHLLKDHQSVHASIIEKDFLKKTYKVKVNSTVYEVQISNPLDVLIEKMGLGVVSNLQVNEVKAPMPGLLLEVNVAVGDEVEEGQTLLILEAMKMENSLTSPRQGTIKHIAVEKGSTVAKNDLLIEFE
jgi:biotin carboxyl carrier protein